MVNVQIVADGYLLLIIMRPEYALLAAAVIANLSQDIVMTVILLMPTMSVIIAAQAKYITVINAQPVTAQVKAIVQL
jgi:nitrogenase subunit NifH